MVVTLCDSAAVKIKAGDKADALTDAEYTAAINRAEGFICSQARYDFVANSGAVSAIGKTLLQDVASSKAAIEVINKDMSGFSSRTEAQVMLDANYTNVVDIINMLRDDKYKEFVIKGTVE